MFGLRCRLSHYLLANEVTQWWLIQGPTDESPCSCSIMMLWTGCWWHWQHSTIDSNHKRRTNEKSMVTTFDLLGAPKRIGQMNWIKIIINTYEPISSPYPLFPIVPSSHNELLSETNEEVMWINGINWESGRKREGENFCRTDKDIEGHKEREQKRKRERGGKRGIERKFKKCRDEGSKEGWREKEGKVN